MFTNRTIRGMFGLGIAKSVLAIAAAFAVGTLTDVVGWQSITVAGLAIAMLIGLTQVINTGTQLPNFSDPQHAYIEMSARQASEHDTGEYQRSSINAGWLAALAPQAAALAALITI